MLRASTRSNVSPGIVETRAEPCADEHLAKYFANSVFKPGRYVTYCGSHCEPLSLFFSDRSLIRRLLLFLWPAELAGAYALHTLARSGELRD